MNPAGCPAPITARFPVNPAPAQRRYPRGSSLGRREEEGPCGRWAFSLRARAQLGLPFPVPQFPTRLQGLRQWLFRTDGSAL